MRRPKTVGEILESIVRAMETEDPGERQQILDLTKKGIQDLKRREGPGPRAGRAS